MSLIYSYAQVRMRRPVHPLGGRMTRPRALIDDTVFHESVAALIGIDLTNAPTGEATGVGMVPSPIRYAQVNLRITDGREFCDWPAWVGFTTVPLRRPLLGYAGFLQFFDATFRGGREEVELVTNPFYPGRVGPLGPLGP